jgi:hypothetical protein
VPCLSSSFRLTMRIGCLALHYLPRQPTCTGGGATLGLGRVPRHVCARPPSPLLAVSAGSSGPRGTLRRGTSGCGQAQEAGLERWLAGWLVDGMRAGRETVAECQRVCVERRSMCAYVRCVCVCVYLRECWRVLDRSFAASPPHRPIPPQRTSSLSAPGFLSYGVRKGP